MGRIVKQPEVRRAEIIEAAAELFEKDGYINTPVESIIKKTGIAKGTFYYYFKTKEDVLSALVEKTTLEMKKHFISIIETNASALDKLRLMLRGRKKNEIASSQVMEIIHKPENREMQEKMNIDVVKVIAPLITKVLEQGKTEGIFSKSASLEVVQLILAGSQFVLDSGLFDWPIKKKSNFLNEIQILFEFIVGVEKNTLSFISKN